MTDKVNLLLKYTCNICNKEYASQSSLCNHNKKFHQNNNINNNIVNTDVNNVNTNVNIVNTNVNNVNKIILCNKCNKIFTSRQAKSLHIKKYCKIFNNELEKLDKENKQKELELLLKKEEAKILQLKLKLQKADKVDNITLNKLNKMLLKHNNRIKNSTVNSHNT
jgi:hypothetical protein